MSLLKQQHRVTQSTQCTVPNVVIMQHASAVADCSSRIFYPTLLQRVHPILLQRPPPCFLLSNAELQARVQSVCMHAVM
jgi:hypothetical protein